MVRNMGKCEAIEKLIELLAEKDILSSKEACLLRLTLKSGMDIHGWSGPD